MDNIVKAICDTKVDPKILGQVPEALAEMDQEDRRDFTVRSITVIRILDELSLLDTSPDLAAAIEFRLRAPARVSVRPELRAWSIPGDKQATPKTGP